MNLRLLCLTLIALAATLTPLGAANGEDEAAPVSRKLFTAHGGEWTAEGGVLSAPGGAGPKLLVNQKPFRQGEASVEVFFADRQPGNAGLIVKASDCGVGADRFNGYEIALFAEGYLLVGRHQQNFQSIRTIPCEVPVQKWIKLSVQMTDTTLEVFVDGKSLFRFEDKEHPLLDGQVGLRTWQRPAQFRNLAVSIDGRLQAVPFEAMRREIPKLDGLPPIIFFTRFPLTAPNTISCDIWQSQPRKPGCRIRIVEPSQAGKPVRTIFADPEGCIYDMNLSYDAKTLYFSYRKARDKYWHIWQIGVNGAGLRQLTDGPYYDISPLLLPGGDILFVSTRRGGYTVCQPGPASNLHRMSPDGSNIHCVSMNTLADFSPQMLPDGRVLFTRWEYIDRDLTFRQSLWTQNPDGTGYQLFFGNTIREVATFWQARPLPGANDRVVATFAPHHNYPHGAIGWIDKAQGIEAPRGKGYRFITSEFSDIRDNANEWSYRDPYPLSESLFLCAYGGRVNRFRIYLLGSDEGKRLVAEDSEQCCHNPLPLVSTQPPPVISSSLRTEPGERTGTFLLADVYRGLGPKIARGTVKRLRVMEQVRKSEDLVNRAYDQSPVMSYGTYYAKRCWGEVPVLADGSAHFKAPALREIYFQALDAEGRELQRMTSAAQVMPGETVSCIGCHERRSDGPPTYKAPLSASRPAMDLVPMPWGEDGIVDFPTIVQPVLDKYCVKCHGGGNPDGGCDLTGGKTRIFNMAYDNLLGRSRSYRQHNMDTGEMLPEEAAKGKPLVHFFWLLRTPTAVNQPLTTGCYQSRLLEYIDKEHYGVKMPLEDRQRIYLWIDANVPYYGTYAHSHPNSAGRRDRFSDPETGRELDWYARDFIGVYKDRCASCHGDLPHPSDQAQIWDGRLAWINLSAPQDSPALTAHLARIAGGRGIDTPRDGKLPPMFSSTDDAAYQAMLKAIETGKAAMEAAPEADMQGFAHKRKEP